MQTSAYLATFIYQPSGGAEGVFNIVVKSGDEVLILDDSTGALRTSASGDTELIGVGIDCYEDAHCDDDNDCTTDTCSDYECSYQNVSQGTPCDDGLFCTLADECDGNGTCVGSGTPCSKPWAPQCCENADECVCATCPCSEP